MVIGDLGKGILKRNCSELEVKKQDSYRGYYTSLTEMGREIAVDWGCCSGGIFREAEVVLL